MDKPAVEVTITGFGRPAVGAARPRTLRERLTGKHPPAAPAAQFSQFLVTWNDWDGKGDSFTILPGDTFKINIPWPRDQVTGELMAEAAELFERLTEKIPSES